MVRDFVLHCAYTVLDLLSYPLRSVCICFFSALHLIHRVRFTLLFLVGSICHVLDNLRMYLCFHVAYAAKQAGEQGQ